MPRQRWRWRPPWPSCWPQSSAGMIKQKGVNSRIFVQWHATTCLRERSRIAIGATHMLRSNRISSPTAMLAAALYLAGILAFGFPQAFAQDVVGTVRDGGGAPISGARVLFGQNGATPEREAMTAQPGKVWQTSP